MVAEYSHHHRHHMNFFMPMLCLRPSTQDEKLLKWEVGIVSSDHNNFDDEPASPRVGCMGQVKRSNKVVSLIPSHHRITSNNNNTNKYFKLKKIFSAKNLNSSNTNNRTRRETMVASVAKFHDHQLDHVSISLVDLDPPLPVVKPRPCVGKDGNDVSSLWKRRSGGEALKGLQLQQRLHLPSLPQPNSI